MGLLEFSVHLKTVRERSAWHMDEVRSISMQWSIYLSPVTDYGTRRPHTSMARHVLFLRACDLRMIVPAIDPLPQRFLLDASAQNTRHVRIRNGTTTYNAVQLVEHAQPHQIPSTLGQRHRALAALR